MQCFRVLLQQELGFNEETMKVMEWGVRAVEARRHGRDAEQEQRRQAEQEEKTEQEQSKQGKQVSFGEEQHLGKTGAENAGEPEVMGRTTRGTDRKRKCRPRPRGRREVSGGRDQQERQRKREWRKR